MSLGIRFLLVAGLMLGLVEAGSAADTPKTAGIEAKAALDELKKLAGEWNAAAPTDHDGHLGKATKVNYKITAAGSAVLETQFPGSDHEMLSIYHLDGDNLVMTHYCAAQNQPRLKLNRDKSTLKRLVFDFDGGTNFNPAKDIHIHSAVIHLEGKAVRSEWVAYQNGKPFHTEVFQLSK